METTMLQPCPAREAIDHRQLSPRRWQKLKQDVRRRAHAARVQALRGLSGRIGLVVRRAAGFAWALAVACVAAVHRRIRAYAIRRAHRHAIWELGRLDGRLLKDLGIHRSEVESVVYGLHRDRAPERRRAAPRRDKADDRTAGRPAAAARGPEQWIDKDAA
jgi:uncharacterized protein YjiS (DUF1127 family)